MINQTKAQFTKIRNDFKIFDFLNQMIPVLLGMYIFFNPFPHTTSFKEISFYLSVAIVMVLVIFKKTGFTFRTPLLLPIGLFVFWAFLSIFWALNVKNTIHDFYSHLIRYIIFYLILINFFNSKKRLVYLSWAIIFSSTVFSIGGIFYFYVILQHPLSTRFATGFSHIPTNFVGFVTLFAIALTFQNILTDPNIYRKRLLIICIIILSFVTLLTQARSSLIGLFVVGSLMLMKNKRNMFLFMMILLIIIIATPLKKRFSLNNIMYNARVPIFFIASEVIKSHPILGIGFGIETYRTAIDVNAYEEKIPIRIRSIPTPIFNKRTPHNMLFSVTVRLGIVGLALFLYIILVFGKMCLKSIREGKDAFIKSWGCCIGSSIVGFFIIGIFEPSFTHLQDTIFFTILSMITILWQLNEES